LGQLVTAGTWAQQAQAVEAPLVIVTADHGICVVNRPGFDFLDELPDLVEALPPVRAGCG